MNFEIHLGILVSIQYKSELITIHWEFIYLRQELKSKKQHFILFKLGVRLTSILSVKYMQIAH